MRYFNSLTGMMLTFNLIVGAAAYYEGLILITRCSNYYANSLMEIWSGDESRKVLLVFPNTKI